MKRAALVAVVSGFLFAPAARAEEQSLFVGVLPRDPASPIVDVLVGVRSVESSRVRVDDLVLRVGNGAPIEPTFRKPYLDYASEQVRASDLWRPPVTVGLAYLWSEGTPPEVLQGIHRLAKPLPQRTTVLPMPFGRSYFQLAAPTTAGRVAGGGLDDQAPYVGEAINFFDAARTNVSDLIKEEAPVKAWVLVADGRDYRHGSDAAEFAKLGAEIRDRGIVAEVIAVPNASDRAQGIANLRALARAAEARLLIAQNAADLPNRIEAAGTLFLDSTVVEWTLPWKRRLFGGSVTVVVEGTVAGQLVRSEPFAVTVRSSGWGAIVLVVLAALLLIVGVVWLAQRRPSSSSSGGEDLDDFLEALEDLIRRKVPVDRAISDLSRRYPAGVAELPSLDVDALDADRFRVLRARAGRARIAELVKALKSSDHQAQSSAGSGVAAFLEQATNGHMSAADCAKQIRARLPDAEWGAFARSQFAELTHFLKAAAAGRPALRSPQARAFAIAVQDALRTSDGDAHVGVGWLVRSAGPGRRGQTLRLGPERTILGADAACDVRLDAIGLAARHFEIQHDAGTFIVRPMDGPVRVEQTALSGERTLVDGETLEVGQGQFVFKAVVGG